MWSPPWPIVVGFIKDKENNKINWWWQATYENDSFRTNVSSRDWKLLSEYRCEWKI